MPKRDERIDLREEAFRKHMEKMGLLNESYIYSSQNKEQNGYELMMQAINELGDNLPTAFFAKNSQIAEGAIRALLEKKISVPDRVNIIGIDDVGISNMFYPSLSTVKVHTELIGETAVDLFIERMNGRDVSKKIIVSTPLLIRETSF